MKAITGLLRKLRKLNSAYDHDGLFAQVIEPPGKPGRASITSINGVRIALTPMLGERFRFADGWTDAAGAQRWLGIAEIDAVAKSRKIQSQIRRRSTYWPRSLLAKWSPDRVILFGLDTQDQEETYAVFYSFDCEPLVVSYIGYEEKVFADLKAYLRHLTDEDARRGAQKMLESLAGEKQASARR